jgi:hypothetical protein
MKNDKKNQTFLDIDIEALVDGALTLEQQLKLLKLIEASPEALQQLQLLEKQKSLLRRWWGGQEKLS